MANLAAYEFWRAEWVGAARIRSLAAGASGAAGEEGEASRAAAAGSWDGVDDAQRDWCCAHGLVPLALTAVREVVERVMQVRAGRGARSCGLKGLLLQPLVVLVVVISRVVHTATALRSH